MIISLRLKCEKKRYEESWKLLIIIRMCLKKKTMSEETWERNYWSEITIIRMKMILETLKMIFMLHRGKIEPIYPTIKEYKED